MRGSRIRHFPVAILQFLLEIFNFPLGSPYLLATHTEAHSKLILCELARARGARGSEILRFPVEIVTFLPPILR